MSLDQNLFTLTLTPSKQPPPGSIDLIDPSGTVHYRKVRKEGAVGYAWSLYDPLSDGLLATVVAPSGSSKQKTIELHNPSAMVEFVFTGTLTFKWQFEWETHKFEWKREACYMLRKPDPPVLVAVAEPEKKNKNGVVQILDYNLNRFDIEDRKGLEIVMLSALLTFQDHAEESRGGSSSSSSLPTGQQPTTPITPHTPRSPGSNPTAITTLSDPAPPPPPPKAAADIIAALQAKEKRELNEIIVSDEGEIMDYAQHCCTLLSDDNLLFITLLSKSPSEVSKVVAIASATKREMYQISGDEIHQYVRYDEDDSAAGKRVKKVIRLDDGPSKPEEYKPPTTLTIHLSKIPMPELQPKPKPPPLSAHPSSSSSSNPNRASLLPPSGHTKSTSRSSSPSRYNNPSPPPQPKLQKKNSPQRRPSPPRLAVPSSSQPSKHNRVPSNPSHPPFSPGVFSPGPFSAPAGPPPGQAYPTPYPPYQHNNHPHAPPSPQPQLYPPSVSFPRPNPSSSIGAMNSGYGAPPAPQNYGTTPPPPLAHPQPQGGGTHGGLGSMIDRLTAGLGRL